LCYPSGVSVKNITLAAMPTPSTSDLPKPKSWDEFEDITWEIYKRKWHDNHAEKYGRSGQAQNGIDIYGQENSSGNYIGVQCKRYKDNKLNKEIINEEIVKAEGFSSPLNEYIIATTESRDTKLQDFVWSLNEERRLENKFLVYIVFWEDICNDLADPNNRDLLKKYYSEWEQIFSNQEKSISSEQVASIHCLLICEIQHHCNLLQELLNQNPMDLSEKWQICFSQNRGVLGDFQSRLLLARSSRELMSNIQNFYHQLDDIESRCKTLLALISQIQSLESKPKYHAGLGLNTILSRDFHTNSFTESDMIKLINLNKTYSTKFNKLNEKVHETLNIGNQITCDLN
jgi:hypothetical protein